MSTCLGACDVYAGTCVYVCMCVSVHERGGKRGCIWSFVVRFMCVYEDAICVCIYVKQHMYMHVHVCAYACVYLYMWRPGSTSILVPQDTITIFFRKYLSLNQGG